MTTEAQCPECEAWNRVAPTGPYVVPADFDAMGNIIATALMHGPWWWTDADGDPENGPAGCPSCDATVLVESECCFRNSPDDETGCVPR